MSVEKTVSIIDMILIVFVKDNIFHGDKDQQDWETNMRRPLLKVAHYKSHVCVPKHN